MKLFVVLSLIFFTFSGAFAEDADVNYLALTQMLIKDGNFSRAERTLKKVDEAQNDQQALTHSLWGMIELKKGRYHQALERFKTSISLGLNESEVFLFMAETHLKLNQLANAASALKQVSGDLKKQVAYHLLAAEIQWRMGNQMTAWKILDSATALGLSKNIILKKKFYYMLDQGLFQAASDLVFALISNYDNFTDVLAMASQLRLHNQHQHSLTILQTLNVMRPGNELVVLEMAQNYLAIAQPFSAALVLEEAVKHNNSLAFEAGELLRQVGKGYRARYLNLLTTEPVKKLKQQLALFLEDDDYFSLALMVPQLRHHKLLEDQKIRYAVAYSFFKTGEFTQSENFLNLIDDDELFDKSIELKKEIESCRRQSWSCEVTL